MKTRRNIAYVGLVALVLAAPAAARPEPDRLTPGDAEVILTINVRQMLRTPVVKKHALDPLQALLQHNSELQQLLSAAGLDPLRDVDTIALSTSGNPAAEGKVLAIVRGTFDPDKARTAAEEYAKKHPDRLKHVKFASSRTSGELPMWEIVADNKSFFAAFADKKTLVMTTSKEETAAVVHRADGPPQALNKDMQAALDQIKNGESVWLAMVATEQIRQLLKSDNMAKEFADVVQSVTGGLELNDDAQLTLVIHTNSPTAAGRIKSKLEDLMKFLTFLGASKDAGSRIVKEVIDNIKLDTAGNDASVRLKITDAQIDKARKNE